MKSFRSFLLEKFFDSKKAPDGQIIEVFLNPSQDEMNEVAGRGEQVRGFITTSGNLYIWDVYKDHLFILGLFKFENGSYTEENLNTLDYGIRVHIVDNKVFLATIENKLLNSIRNNSSQKQKIQKYFDNCKQKNNTLDFHATTLPYEYWGAGQ